jgi:hypothetical protein
MDQHGENNKFILIFLEEEVTGRTYCRQDVNTGMILRDIFYDGME